MDFDNNRHNRHNPKGTETMKTITLVLRLTLPDGGEGVAKLEVLTPKNERLTPLETALRDTLAQGVAAAATITLKTLGGIKEDRK